MIEGNLGSRKIALQRAAREVGRAAIFEQAVLNELVLDRAVCAELTARRVAAVEAHKSIGQSVAEFVLDLPLIETCRHGIVDVQQCDRIVTDAKADVLAQRTVNVNFTCHGNPACRKAGVYITRFEPELLGESQPAFIGKGNVLAGTPVRLRPVEERQLKLRLTRQQIGIKSAIILEISSAVPTGYSRILLSGS